tara:strand:+ start:3577 stop:3723 length:147 start_codon:yes stop_codon:yes gene_type:complete
MKNNTLGTMPVNELLAKLKSEPVLDMYYRLLLNLVEDLELMEFLEEEN